MTPSSPSRLYETATIPRPRTTAERLRFKPMGLDDIPVLRRFLPLGGVRTCDFTIGGLMMWAEYFSYSYAILEDTLFVKGVTEDDVTRPAFSFPVGPMPLGRAVRVLKDYCRANGAMPLTFSAVPEEKVAALRALGAAETTLLEDWQDYLYSAEALATLTGKKLSKKRNHVNRFMAEHPDRELTPISRDNIEAVKEFYHACRLPLSKPALADIERQQVLDVLDHLESYPFEGAVLTVGPDRRIVAFAIGEVAADTLYVHIEKMDHSVSGAGETINKMFAELMCRRHREIACINREEDTGDPGLRAAKESYHPMAMLRKYNITML